MLGELQELAVGQAERGGARVLRQQVSVEHAGIVGRKRDERAGFEEFAKRMVRERRVRLSDLLR